MKKRSVEDLCAIAKAGGSLVLHADVRSTEELIRIAGSLEHGAQLTLQGMILRPTEDLCAIAQTAPGRVTFQA